AARRIKQDVALLLSGRSAMDGATPKIPSHMATEVDKACAGDVNAVRNLLSMLKDNHSVLTLARAENGQGLRRGASSCDPAPRCPTTASISPPVGGGRDSAGVSTPAIPPKSVIPACFAHTGGGTGPPPTDAATSAKDAVPPKKSSSEPAAAATAVSDAMAPAADPAPATPDLSSTTTNGIASKRRSAGGGGRTSSSRPALPPSFLTPHKESGGGGGDTGAGSPPATAGSAGPVVALAVAGASSDEDLVAIEGANTSVVVAGGGGGVDVRAAPAARGRHHAMSRASRSRKPVPSGRESSSLPPKASRASLSRLAPVDEPPQPPTLVEPAQAARVGKIFASDSRGPPPPPPPPPAVAGTAAAVVEVASPPQAAPLGVNTSTPPAAATPPATQGQARGAPCSSPSPSPATQDWAKALAWRSSTPTRLASRRRTFESPLRDNKYATTSAPRRDRAVSLQAPGLLRALPPEITKNSSMPALLPSVRVKPPPPVVVTSVSSSSLAPAAAAATAARPRSAGIASDPSARRSPRVAAEGAVSHSTAAAPPKGRARRGSRGRAKGAPTPTTAAAADDGGEAKGKEGGGGGGGGDGDGVSAKRHSASRKKSSKDRTKRRSSSSPAADRKEGGGSGGHDVAGVNRAPSSSNRSASPAEAGEGGAAKTAAVASRGRGEDHQREASPRTNRAAPSDRSHRAVENKKEKDVSGRNTGSEAAARTAAAEAAATEAVAAVTAEAKAAAAVRRRRPGSPDSPQEVAEGTTTTTEEAPAATVATTAAPRELENGAATATPRNEDKAAALVAALVAAKARGGGREVVPPNPSDEQPRNQRPQTESGGSATAARRTKGCAREAAVKLRAPFATAAPTEGEADAGQSCAEVDGAAHKSRSLRATGESAGGALAVATVRVGASDRDPAAARLSVVPSTDGQEEEGEAVEAEATDALPVSRGSGRVLMPAQLPLLRSGTVDGGGVHADGIAGSQESPAAPDESPQTASARMPAVAAAPAAAVPAVAPIAAPAIARGTAVEQDSSLQAPALTPAAALDAEQETLNRTGQEGEAEELPACGGSPAEAFGSRCPHGVNLVVEFLGSVESVPTAMFVSSSWKAAVLSDQQRLYKGIVRRAGVTPLWRAGFWEFMILRSNRASASARKNANTDRGALGASPPAGNANNSSSGEAAAAAASSSPQFSLAELARQGMDSEWAKAIDADVARTFGERPMSFRGEFGSMTRQVWF
ncbi:unnamed protein product, partial [Ectocarpus fasciculatus]